MRVAIYCRVSTDDKGQDEKIQIKDCLTINKWGEYKLYLERQSAYKDNKREVFDSIKTKIKAGEIDHLIVWDWDRIYRNRKKLKSFFEFCKAYKCKIHSYRQRFLEDIHKIPEPWNDIVMDMFIQLFGYMAEDESRKKGDRVKMAVRKKGNQTVSYKGNKWGRKRLSKFKRNKIQELRKKNYSIRKIADELGLSAGVVHKYL